MKKNSFSVGLAWTFFFLFWRPGNSNGWSWRHHSSRQDPSTPLLIFNLERPQWRFLGSGEKELIGLGFRAMMTIPPGKGNRRGNMIQKFCTEGSTLFIFCYGLDLAKGGQIVEATPI